MNTTNTHTPGPWYVYRSPHGLLHVLDVKEPTINTRQICTFNGSAFWGESEISANARLIAAAPELLEVLKSIEAWASATSENEYRRLFRIREEARAAIAKAEGKA